MTTTIITNTLGPFCELYYKYKESQNIQQQNFNTLRNYGFNTSFSVNFGFELYSPFDINNIKLMPGVYTYNDKYYVSPDLSSTTTLSISNNNNFVIQDLPDYGIGTVRYQDMILPVVINIQQNGSSIAGVASNYLTYGVPYDKNFNLKDGIIRQFESDWINSDTLSMLIFINLQDTTFTGINTSWYVSDTSLYNIEDRSYRINNGYGQFYSALANFAFQGANLTINTQQLNTMYQITYSQVYNWINYLDWTPDFLTWFAANKNSLDSFILQFLSEYFGIT